jgi:hypothetical protein
VDRDELLRVLRAFEEAGLEYVLIGATAMGLHGVVRATEDVDLFVRVERLGRSISRTPPRCAGASISGKMTKSNRGASPLGLPTRSLALRFAGALVRVARSPCSLATWDDVQVCETASSLSPSLSLSLAAQDS